LTVASSISSKDLLEKSVQAALSAIEIYNKPDFRYREEAFAILMCNSCELLLKAKALLDNAESIDAIVATRSQKDEKTGETKQVPKLNRCGSPKNPKSRSKKFFSTEVFKVFDLHYERKAAG